MLNNIFQIIREGSEMYIQKSSHTNNIMLLFAMLALAFTIVTGFSFAKTDTLSTPTVSKVCPLQNTKDNFDMSKVCK